MNDFETLSVKRHGAVAQVTLTRPELLNRFDSKLHVELTRALEHFRAAPEVRAVVLASTGRYFSAGGDFELMMECRASMSNRLRIVDDGRKLFATLVDLPQPIVVALHGDAFGLGASVALACDAIVAAREACICDPHVQLGLVAGDGGCVVWPATAGILIAKRYLLTGDPLGAEDAHKLGMVTDVVDAPDDALPVATRLAERIAALPPLAVQGTKRALNRVLQHRSSEVLDLSFAHEILTLGSDDLVEAISAFKEHRDGQFIGQ